ncbi:unnamed protein product, partial [Didymodactylos carnosus]
RLILLHINHGIPVAVIIHVGTGKLAGISVGAILHTGTGPAPVAPLVSIGGIRTKVSLMTIFGFAEGSAFGTKHFPKNSLNELAFEVSQLAFLLSKSTVADKGATEIEGNLQSRVLWYEFPKASKIETDGGNHEEE